MIYPYTVMSLTVNKMKVGSISTQKSVFHKQNKINAAFNSASLHEIFKKPQNGEQSLT